MLTPRGMCETRQPSAHNVHQPDAVELEYVRMETDLKEYDIDDVFYRGYQRRYATMMAKYWVARHGPFTEAQLMTLGAGVEIDNIKSTNNDDIAKVRTCLSSAVVQVQTEKGLTFES